MKTTSIRKYVEDNPGQMSERLIRRMIYKNEHGFNRCVVRICGKILLDVNEVEAWLVSRKGQAAVPAAGTHPALIPPAE